jgi:hypothetical protein
LGNFADAAKWTPSVVMSRQNGDRTAGTGASRVLKHVWGFQLEEVVTAWDEGRGHTFVVKAPFPLRNVKETWTIDTGSRDASVSTAVEYDMRLGAIGYLIDQVLMRHLIRREMRLGLAALKRYVESTTPLVVGVDDEPGRLLDVGVGKHLVFGLRVLHPSRTRLQVHGAELPMPAGVAETTLETALLLFVADRQPVLQ